MTDMHFLGEERPERKSGGATIIRCAVAGFAALIRHAQSALSHE